MTPEDNTIPPDIKTKIDQYLSATPPRIEELEEYLTVQISFDILTPEQISTITDLVNTRNSQLANPAKNPDNE